MNPRKVLASVLLSAAATMGGAAAASAAPLTLTPASPEPIQAEDLGTGSTSTLGKLATGSSVTPLAPVAGEGTGSSATLIPAAGSSEKVTSLLPATGSSTPSL